MRPSAGRASQPIWHHPGSHVPEVLRPDNLIEDGWDAKFVQDQAGHEYASTPSNNSRPGTTYDA